MLDPRFRFDTFVVGSANRLAVAAARAVAESPGQVYNPLFIYGGSGLGKTHLLGAIADLALDRTPGLRRAYVTLDEFVEELHAAIAARAPEQMKQRYYEIDLLLLDDVQFLTQQPETQAELLRLLNALQAGGRQIVMTSDRPPAEIADVDERLISRLAGGLVVDMGTPDLETRSAILRAAVAERAVQFAPGVVEALAAMPVANVRELQGALNRLVAVQTLGEEQVLPEQVPTLLGRTGSTPPHGGEASGPPVPPSPAPSRAPAATPGGGLLFENFLSDIAVAVAQNVEGWKVRVGEAMAQWGGAGYHTGVLEALLAEEEPPANWEALVRGFGAMVDRLRALETQAVAFDPSLAGANVFRDPSQVADAERLVERLIAGATPPPGPDPAYSRTTFEVGASNQLAVRAVDEVVSEPGKRYNPLFIHGVAGVGKTHLVHALANELVDASGGAARVAVVSAQAFMDELIDALQVGTVGQWRARYRAVDALVVDDVERIAETERTQDELFHLFNALFADGKQLVFAADRAPRALEGLEERLRSRFEGGLVAEVQAPDRALRERVVARALGEADPNVPPELISYLSEPASESVRALLDRVTRVVAASQGGASPLTVELARATLEPADAARAAGTPAAGTPAVRLSGAMRVSGSMLVVDPDGPGDSFFRDEEKVVWHWPDPSGRIIEEPR